MTHPKASQLTLVSAAPVPTPLGQKSAPNSTFNPPALIPSLVPHPKPHPLDGEWQEAAPRVAPEQRIPCYHLGHHSHLPPRH